MSEQTTERPYWRTHYRNIIESPDLSFDEKVGYMVAAANIDLDTRMPPTGRMALEQSAQWWREALK